MAGEILCVISYHASAQSCIMKGFMHTVLPARQSAIMQTLLWLFGGKIRDVLNFDAAVDKNNAVVQ